MPVLTGIFNAEPGARAARHSRNSELNRRSPSSASKPPYPSRGWRPTNAGPAFSCYWGLRGAPELTSITGSAVTCSTTTQTGAELTSRKSPVWAG